VFSAFSRPKIIFATQPYVELKDESIEDEGMEKPMAASE
jgi:hypothetical protein